ncbi:tyrosine-type recombinase/integrase [Williamsia sp. SKLECPSW1]
MAWVEQLPSGSWRGMYRDASGRKRSSGVSKIGKRDAEARAQAAEVAARGKTTGAPVSDLTWGEWRPTWMSQRTVAAGTLIEDEKRVERHVEPRWGSVKLVDIRRADVQRWVSELSASGLSPSTVRKIHAVLSASMSAAARMDLVETNPCSDVAKPALPPTEEHWLSDDEIEALRDTIDERHLFTYELLIGTGLRWGECAGLHWTHVDFDRSTIEVVWAADRKAGGFKAPKSNQKRTVPVSERLLGLLSDRLEAMGWGEPPDANYVGGRRPPHGLVLAGKPGGGAPDPKPFSMALSAAGRAATVGEGARKRKVGAVRVHDLRHSYATRLVRRGVSILAVSKLMGHSSVVVTQRYASAGDTEWDAVRTALG